MGSRTQRQTISVTFSDLEGQLLFEPPLTLTPREM